MLLFTVGKKLVLRTSNAKVFRGIFNAHYAQHLREKGKRLEIPQNRKWKTG